MMLPSFRTASTCTRAGRRAILFPLVLSVAAAAVASNNNMNYDVTTSRLPRSAAPLAEEEVAVVGHDANINGDARRVLQEPRYRNNYRGSFQYLVDGGCSGDYPVVQAYCKGTITVHKTSHSTIQCAPLLPANNTEFPGYNGYECTTDACGDYATCSKIFQESHDYSTGVFGEVYFQCDGIDVLDVEGFFVWKAATGSCRGGVELGGRNIHVLSLAVFCTPQNAFSAGDTYFECRDSDNLRLDTGGLACGEGENCKGSACEVEFATMAVVSDLHNMEYCIQSLDGTSEVPAIPAPAPIPRSQGTYKTPFWVQWSMALGNFCDYTDPTVTISCTNGIIGDVVTDFPTTTCTMVNDSEMTCTEDDESTFVLQYSGVKYTCTAVDEVPTTEAVFEEGTILCEVFGSFVDDVNIGHKLRLSPRCGSLATGGKYPFADGYVECNARNFFTYEDDRFVCYAEKPGDNCFDVGTVEAVRMYTDFRWANYAAAECYEYVAAPGAVPIPIPSSPRAVPTKAPVTAVAPVAAKPSPTEQRPITATPTATTEASVRPPTKAPEKSPTKAPVRPPTKAPTTTDSPVRADPAPTEAPVRPPAIAPTRAPTKAPVRPPTKAPATTDSPVRADPPQVFLLSLLGEGKGTHFFGPKFGTFPFHFFSFFLLLSKRTQEEAWTFF